jgi:hypothetical protein
MSLFEAEGNSLFTSYYGIWNGKLSKKCEKMDLLRKRYLRLKAARASGRVRVSVFRSTSQLLNPAALRQPELGARIEEIRDQRSQVTSQTGLLIAEF